MPPARFERTAPGLGILCSIHLSYGGSRLSGHLPARRTGVQRNSLPLPTTRHSSYAVVAVAFIAATFRSPWRAGGAPTRRAPLAGDLKVAAMVGIANSGGSPALPGNASGRRLGSFHALQKWIPTADGAELFGRDD